MAEHSEMEGGTITHIQESWHQSPPHSDPGVSSPSEKPLVKSADSDTESTSRVNASSLDNNEDKDSYYSYLLEDSEDLNALLSVDFEDEEEDDDDDADDADDNETSQLSLTKKTKKRRISHGEEEEDEVNSKPVTKVNPPSVHSSSTIEDEDDETRFVSRRKEIKHRVNLLKGILPARAGLDCKDADVVLDETIRYMRVLQDTVLKLEARKRARPTNTGSLCKRTG